MTNGARASVSPTPATLDAMQQYIDLVRHVLEFGDRKAARTGVDTISVFGGHDGVDLAEGDPLLTTKQMYWKSMLHELLWCLSGEDHVRNLRQKTKVWENKDGTDPTENEASPCGQTGSSAT